MSTSEHDWDISWKKLHRAAYSHSASRPGSASRGRTPTWTSLRRSASRSLTIPGEGVSVEGRLNEASIRATLVPVGKGRHRLFVNGGMREAAGVAVGDTVSFELLSTAHANVSVPEDLADALDEVDGAREAFEAMSPSHRRELIRYVDDARTPSTRERRIGRTADHALGKPPADRRPSGRPMWNCPRCGNRFVNKNQYHSCKRYSLTDPFEGKPDKIRGLFDRVPRDR